MRPSGSRGVRPNPWGDRPEVDVSAWIDPSAEVIGRVVIEAGVFVGPRAVLRADEQGEDGRVEPIVIGAGSNIQDGVIVHALGGTQVRIGPRASLAHGAIVHGPCVVGEGCFIGFGAVVFRAEVGAGAFIGSRALVEDAHVAPGGYVPACSCLCGEGGGRVGRAGAADRRFAEKVVDVNLRLAGGYARLARPSAPGDARPG